MLNFAVSADYMIKLKESAERDKYLDLVGELKKTVEHESDSDISCNLAHSVLSPKVLIQGLEDLEIRGQVETIQTRALLRSARILRRGPGA